MKNSECLGKLNNGNFSINGDVECREINVTLDLKDMFDERLMEVFCTVSLIGKPTVKNRSFILNPDNNPTILTNFKKVFLNKEHLIKVCDNKAIDLALSSLEESKPYSQQYQLSRKFLDKFSCLKNNS